MVLTSNSSQFTRSDFAPFRLVSRIWSHSASSCSNAGVRCVIPAQFTRMSTFPNSSITLSRSASKLARSPTHYRRPAPHLLIISQIISQTASCTSERRRPVGTTLAPASASPMASAEPIREVPPITTAVFESRSNAGCPMICFPLLRHDAIR